MSRSTTETPLPEIDQLREARAAGERLAERERNLREQHRAATRALKAVLSAPEPIEDVVRNVRALVATEAARFAAEHGLGIVRAASQTFESATDGRWRPKPAKLYDPPHDFGRLTFAALCGLAPGLVAEQLETIVRATSYAAGPSAADRDAAREQAEAAIARLEDEHAALVDAAVALDPPIGLRHLEAVARRRADEARRRQLEAERVAGREARQDALDTAYDHAVNPRKTRAVELTDPPAADADPDRTDDGAGRRAKRSDYLAGESAAPERQAIERASRPRPA